MKIVVPNPGPVLLSGMVGYLSARSGLRGGYSGRVGHSIAGNTAPRRKRHATIVRWLFRPVADSGDGTAELVLVSGYSGVGKSSVVNELHKALLPPRGLFAAGKFDQYKRDVPYATLAQAFQMLVRQILVTSEPEVDRWRRALLTALEPNGHLIVNLIPELEFVIGKQPPAAELPPQEARGRFQLVFQRFLGVFARAEHPLVLFLDDLQWLDTATLGNRMGFADGVIRQFLGRTNMNHGLAVWQLLQRYAIVPSPRPCPGHTTKRTRLTELERAATEMEGTKN